MEQSAQELEDNRKNLIILINSRSRKVELILNGVMIEYELENEKICLILLKPWLLIFGRGD